MAATALLTVPAMAVQQGPTGQAAPAARVDPYAVRQLCTLIRREIAKLRPDVSIEDAEAAIVFALSQANPSREIIDPALLCAGSAGDSANVLQAIENVRRSYAQSGTGAIQGGSGTNGGASFFSPPVVGIGGGGGGSNYTAG